VNGPEGLNNEVLEEIFRLHFNRSDLKIASVNGNDNFLAENDNFNSVIRKWVVQLEMGEGVSPAFNSKHSSGTCNARFCKM
jgi:hypothetical protein